jgi:hypothetical protein
VLAALESPKYMMQDVCFLSIHALSGKPQHRAIQLRAMVKNQALIVLVDSESSHTFLNSVIANKLKLETVVIPKMVVQVANGASITCSTEVPNFDWWIQGHTFQVAAKILDMGAYDLVLGIDWLEKFSPMTCDWLESGLNSNTRVP